jgi:hypothetical protein
MGREQRSRTRRQAGQPCVYCGVAPGTTQDHVPPKGLFPQPRPDLIKVPCCEACRSTQSLDDEYFKNMLVMRHDVASHPAAARLLDSVHRAFTRPEGRGLTTALLKTVREVEIRTLGSGLCLGQGATYQADVHRLDAVMRRTVRGLYFHEAGVRLPDTHHVTLFSVAGLQNPDADTEATLRRLVDLAVSGRIRVLGDMVFVYAFQTLADAEHCTLWVLLVYDRVVFVGFTGPRDQQLLQDERAARWSD